MQIIGPKILLKAALNKERLREYLLFRRVHSGRVVGLHKRKVPEARIQIEAEEIACEGHPKRPEEPNLALALPLKFTKAGIRSGYLPKVRVDQEQVGGSLDNQRPPPHPT